MIAFVHIYHSSMCCQWWLKVCGVRLITGDSKQVPVVCKHVVLAADLSAGVGPVTAIQRSTGNRLLAKKCLFSRCIEHLYCIITSTRVAGKRRQRLSQSKETADKDQMYVLILHLPVTGTRWVFIVVGAR